MAAITNTLMNTLPHRTGCLGDGKNDREGDEAAESRCAEACEALDDVSMDLSVEELINKHAA
jgi:hypothetical protein